jgi:hypothetical protein
VHDAHARFRRGFDRASGGRESVPTFPSVIDAGCRTGIVGEQVRRVWRNGFTVLLLYGQDNEMRLDATAVYNISSSSLLPHHNIVTLVFI